MRRHCDDQALMGYVHHTLPWGRELAVRAHMRRCEACRTRHGQMVGATVALGAMARGEASAEMPAFLIARGKARVRRRWWTALGAAAVAGAATLYWFDRPPTPVSAQGQSVTIGMKGDCK